MLPTQLQRNLNIINQYLETPIDLEGKKPAELMKRKSRRRTRRKREATPDPDASDDELQRKKREKRRKEKQVYKSADFIVDSDAEMGDMDEFLAKERALRLKISARAAATGQSGTMRAHGTKKRRRKGKDDKGGKKRRKRNAQQGEDGDADAEKVSDASGGEERAKDKGGDSASDSDDSDFNVFGSPKRARAEATPDTSPPANEEEEELPKPKPRPRPRPRARAQVSGASSPVAETSSPAGGGTANPVVRPRSPSHVLSDDEAPPGATLRAGGGKKTARLVFSDDEE